MSGRVGVVAWLAGAAQFLVVQLIVGAAWATPYSWADNNISDLGNVGCGMWDESRPRYVCSPLHGVMNVSFVAQGILLLVGVVLTGAYWGRGAFGWTARILLMVAAVGWIVVGLAPADVDENLHLLGALFIMGLGNIGLVCAGWLPRTAAFGRVRSATRVLAVVAVVSAVLFFGQRGPVIGMGGMERVAAFTVSVWTVLVAVTVLCARRTGETESASIARSDAG
ncbi:MULTISPECIES: DUF998 domain-containing protein [unclassified Nocardia]|uniref:DUF998 domain-containing protein n=1 Tax=unclassified Nocardia TaxID=2637762 RepID=UPI001CE462CE|nr:MULTISPECIES: DUF998 domain-containing protein [unclassified Nocardia]